MNFLRSLKNLIRGWLPKEPALPRKQSQIPQNNEKVKKPKYKSSIFRYRIIFCLLFTLRGLMYLFSNRYDFASLWFAGAIGIAIFAYFGWTVRLRKTVGVFLIGSGVAVFFYYDFAVSLFGSLPVFASLLIYIVSILWFPTLFVIAFVAYAIWIRRSVLRINLTKRHLLPYGASAAFIFLTYIAIVSGIQFAFAIPLTFIASGILVLKGLRRFTVTIPALAVLLISMSLFGSAVAGMYTVTYVSEDRYLTSAQVPDVDTMNLTAKSTVGDIKVYFTDDDAQICHIAFVKEYGPIISDKSSEYRSQSHYDSEPATSFNYTVENREVNVTASSYTVLVNITVNQNLKLNFDLYTRFGDITVEAPPTTNNIQTMNLTSQYGTVKTGGK
jgi:hypothetical protein